MDKFSPRSLYYYMKKEMALDMLKPREKMWVLDIGCGTGGYLLDLMECGSDTIGIDRDSLKLRMAKERMELYGFRGTIIRSDVTHLPFRNSSFDKVICIDVLHIPPNYPDVVREISRVLKAGGFLICTLINKNFPPLPFLWTWISRKTGRKVRFLWQEGDYNPNLFDEHDLRLFNSDKLRLMKVINIFGCLWALLDWGFIAFQRILKVDLRLLFPLARIINHIDVALGRILPSNEFLVISRKSSLNKKMNTRGP